MRRTLAFGLACTLVTGLAWGYWSIGSVPGGNGQAQAATVGQGNTPTATVNGSAVTLSWAASTLTNGQAVDGYRIKRYSEATHTSQTILSACTGTVTATTCVESNVPSGDWVYTVTPVFGANWLGVESQDSDPVTADGTAPVNNLSLSAVSGGAFKSGTTVYYRGVAAGSLRFSNNVVDLGSGPASSATAALGGTSTGWAHTPSTVSTPTGGPFVSNLFTWGAGTSTAPTEVITGRDLSGNTAQTSVSFTNDSTAPTGSISYADGNQAGRAVALTLTAADAGSGLNTRQIQRASAPLTGSTCGTFSSFTNFGSANPTSPYNDTTVTTGNCYKYQYVVTDKVGNSYTATTTNVAKIGYAGAIAGTSGSLSHWRLGESAATLDSADSFTESSGTLVKNHVGETGATWTAENGGAGAGQETIGTDGRAYRAGKGLALVYTDATPASPNYSVEADLHQKTLLNNDTVGVFGRMQGTGAGLKLYTAGRSTGGAWQIGEVANASLSPIATASASTLTVGQTYRVRLEMSGTTPTTTLKLYVNGVLVLTGSDSTAPLTAVGKAGFVDGTAPPAGDAVVKSSSVGLHVDNFQVTPASYPRAADSKGSSTGDYVNGPVLGVTGAIAGDTAARFNGVNQYMQAGGAGVPVGTSNRSVEMWFKTTSTGKEVLFSYGSASTNQAFGLWLNAGGATMTAWGSGDDKTFALASAVNDGNWHQVVKTYNGSQIQLYVDGAPLAAQNATRSTTTDSYGFVVGAILNPASSSYGNFFDGSVDEVSLYNTVLSQATVTNHYELRNMTPVGNVAPTGTSSTLTGTEDVPTTLATADFGYDDPEEGHDLQAVKITTLPGAGTLKLNGANVTAGQLVPAASIASGLLVFHPGADGNGTPYTSFTFQVQDNGGTANGGVDLDPTPNTLTFDLAAVNDTPTFTKGANQTVVGDTGAYSIPNWATNISAGGPDESGQTLTFQVTTPLNPDLFSVKPAISSSGTLTYTLRSGVTGTTTVSVKLKDNGGGGAVDTSPAQTFTITVTQPVCTPGSSTVTASADAWTSEASPSQNKGADSALYVASKNGNGDKRALVQFSLPTIPNGCTLSSATFELSAETATAGRTINVSRASAIWSGNTVTWANQPAPVAGTAVSAAAGTGWRSWTVTSLVQSHYTGSNTGFVVQDSVESQSSEKQQKFRSIETGGTTKPKLTVSWN